MQCIRGIDRLAGGRNLPGGKGCCGRNLVIFSHLMWFISCSQPPVRFAAADAVPPRSAAGYA
ncbi:MAG: hypothetical protein OXU61_08700 [Gammaproteobacteria bacterium]|nr:hypothetical protein [Gammaproteobacteria bacterium]